MFVRARARVCVCVCVYLAKSLDFEIYNFLKN